MAREDLHFRLRIPADLKQRIEAYADTHGRSMTAEIVSRLYESVNNDSRARLMEGEMQSLKKAVEKCKKDLATQQAISDKLKELLRLSDERARLLMENNDALKQLNAAIEAVAIPTIAAIQDAANGDNSALNRLLETARRTPFNVEELRRHRTDTDSKK